MKKVNIMLEELGREIIVEVAKEALKELMSLRAYPEINDGRVRFYAKQ